MRGAGSALILAALLAGGEARARPITAPAVQEGQAAPTTAQPTPPTVPAPRVRRGHAPGDPLEGLNRKLFAVHQFFDRILFRPAALVYKAIFPKPLRRGISHLFSNIAEPIVFVNDVLQLRPKHAAETLSRFIINSTAGVGGIFDVAKTAGLPHRNNGFGNTLARYGVGPGPYLFIPFFGPGNFRDSLSTQIDGIVLPIGVGFPFSRAPYTFPSTVFPGLQLRLDSDDALKTLLGGAADPYATLRSVYTQNREAEVAEVRGKAQQSPLDDPLLDPEAPAGATETPATAAGAPADTPPADAPPNDVPATDTPPADSAAINPVTTPPPIVVPQ